MYRTECTPSPFTQSLQWRLPHRPCWYGCNFPFTLFIVGKKLVRCSAAPRNGSRGEMHFRSALDWWPTYLQPVEPAHKHDAHFYIQQTFNLTTWGYRYLWYLKCTQSKSHINWKNMAEIKRAQSPHISPEVHVNLQHGNFINHHWGSTVNILVFSILLITWLCGVLYALPHQRVQWVVQVWLRTIRLHFNYHYWNKVRYNSCYRK